MSFLQLGLSALAALGLWAVALILGLLGVFDLLGSGFDGTNASARLMLAFSLGMMGMLCLPSVWFSARQLFKSSPMPASLGTAGQRSEVPAWRREPLTLVTLLVLIGMPLLLLAGHLSAQNETLSWLVLPPLNLLASGLPVLWLVLLGVYKLSGGSAQRKWGVFAVSLSYAPLIILTLEILLLVVSGLAMLLWLSSQPAMLNELRELLGELRTVPPPSQEDMLRLIQPYLSDQRVIAVLIVLAAFFVPLIEELFKPLGVWLVAWKKLGPAEGWVAGVISGAGFALFENLGNASGGGDEWALVTASRITAALLHMLTSGLMGWGIASAWSQRRFGRLAAIYAAAVAIHGLWNGLAIYGTISFPMDLPFPDAADLPPGSLAAVAGLVGLFLFNLILYFVMNRALRQKPEPPALDLTHPEANINGIDP